MDENKQCLYTLMDYHFEQSHHFKVIYLRFKCLVYLVMSLAKAFSSLLCLLYSELRDKLARTHAN